MVVVSGVAIAVAYLVAAALAALLPLGVRRGAWLPLHLALAGGATTAVAAVMPFFTAAFAAAPPADVRLRSGAVAAAALGAGGVAVGVASALTWLAVAGGIAFVFGIGLTVLATIAPVRAGLGPGRGIITQGYLAALSMVAVGAAIATLYVAGWPPIVAAWTTIKPAHAWLNLVGFVSLVIATTLLHFFPTIVGARIASTRTARLAVAGIAIGAAVVAGGLAVRSDVAARLGAVMVVAGAISLAVYARGIWGTRARWTTDPGWHRFAMGGMISALAWFEIGIAIASARVIRFGATAEGWAIDEVVAPLVAGWVGLAVLASATHLLPAVGPGDAVAHAAQRAVLGRFADLRLIASNLAIVALAVGLPLRSEGLAIAGTLVLIGSVAATAALLATAVAAGLRKGAERPRQLGSA